LPSSLLYSFLFAQRAAIAGAVGAAITRITVPAVVTRRLDEPGRDDDDRRLGDRRDLITVDDFQRRAVDRQHCMLAVDIVRGDLVAGLGLGPTDEHRLAARPPGLAAVVVFLVRGRLVQLAVLRRAGDAGRCAPSGGQLRSRIVLVVWHDTYGKRNAHG
jgi:hypothetical protein